MDRKQATTIFASIALLLGALALASAHAALAVGCSAAPGACDDLLVTFDERPRASETSFIESLGGVVNQEYASIPALHVTVPRDVTRDLETVDGIVEVASEDPRP